MPIVMTITGLLLAIDEEFRGVIAACRNAMPRPAKELPECLENLLLDADIGPCAATRASPSGASTRSR